MSKWHIDGPGFLGLLAQHRNGSKEALAELVKRMTPLLASEARRWMRYADLEDLLQESVLAFLEVLPKLDVSEASAPIHYSRLWVRGRLVTYVRASGFITKPLVWTARDAKQADPSRPNAPPRRRGGSYKPGATGVLCGSEEDWRATVGGAV